MRRILLIPLWLLLAAPVMCPTRMQEPCDDRNEQWRAADNLEAQGGPWYDCNAGDGSSVLVAAAVIGVVLRRR